MRRQPELPLAVSGRRWRRLLLVSDSHGALAAPLLEAARGVDCIVHSGDVGGAGVLAALRACSELVAVRGNNDTPERWPAAERDELAALPEAARIALAGGELVVIHGHQYPQAKRRHEALRCDYGTARAVVYGHSHRLVIDDALGPWVLNPGACGRARVGPGASGLLLAIGARGWRVTVVGPFGKAPAQRVM